MYELYSEILYEILHVVGYDVRAKGERDVLVQYLQEAFKMDKDKHDLLMEKTRERHAPSIFLNVEVIEAKDLKSTDPNGLSDPFCTLYLTSASSQRFNTSVKTETLHPIWKERFSLPVMNPTKDVLCVEIWDFDPEESTREKMKRIKQVKDVKGIKNFVKEVASASRHNNDLVGSANLPLNNVPAIGETVWCILDKNGKLKKQGEVKLHLSFSIEKNTNAAFQEHRQLLYVLLLHELRVLKIESTQWNGRFSAPAETILTQHRVQCRLPSTSVMLAKWIEFINVHILHPLSFRVFLLLLERLTELHQNNSFTNEEVNVFWEGAKKLISSCMTYIKKLQIETSSTNSTINQTSDILSILSSMSSLQPPKDVELFPFTIYDWLPITESITNSDIKSVVKETVLQGSKDWFAHTLEKNKVSDSPSGEEKLNRLVCVVDHATMSLKSATNYHDKLFQEHFHFPYTKELYKIYEAKLAEMLEPVVATETSSMKPIKFSEDVIDGSSDDETLKTGTSLFQLYLSLQQFSGFSENLCPDDTFVPQDFYHWFYSTALQWLYMSYYKALQGIQKAVNLDHLVPVDETVEHSSSAVDTLQIFEQIRIFWKRLAWPDVEAAFTFATNIVNDICQCSAFYADKIGSKVERLCEDGNFHITKEWCIAVKNIVHVRQSIKTTVAEFGLEEIISSFVKSGNGYSAEKCKLTIQALLESGVDIVNKKISDILERAAKKMAPHIRRLLTETAHYDGNSDTLMKYLDDNLHNLYSNLDSDNFKQIFLLIWKNILTMLYEQVETNIQLNKEPSSFKRDYNVYKTLLNFFKDLDEDVTDVDSIMVKKIEKELLLYGMETPELIHYYYLERREEQRALTTPMFGLITVRLQLTDNFLRIEILNARNLRPLNKRKSCNSYVKISFLPEEKFLGISKMATKVHKKVIFPLFEEKFAVELTPEQISVKDGLVMFMIRDKSLLGEDKFLAESFASFADIVKTDSTVRLDSVEQLHLKLNRPNNSGSEAFQALMKHENKLAKDFVKRRNHMFPTTEEAKGQI